MIKSALTLPVVNRVVHRHELSSLVPRPSITANAVELRPGKTLMKNDVRWTYGGVAYRAPCIQ